MDVTKHDTLFQYRRAAFIKASPVKANGNFYIEHYMVRSWESMGGRTIDDFEP